MSRPNRKSAARLYAVQALFQMEAAGAGIDDVVAEFLNHRFAALDEDVEWVDGHAGLFETLILQAVNHQARIDQATDAALVDRWPISRIDPTLRAIFRAGGAEMVIGDTPVGVVISEFVDVAKAFFPDGKEPKLVHGVLDAMGKALRG